MAGPPRRSGRQRKVNSKYADDLLEEETKQILALESEDEEEVPPTEAADEAADEAAGDATIVESDSEFDVERVTANDTAMRDVSDDEDASIGSRKARDLSDGSDIATPNGSDDDDLISIASSTKARQWSRRQQRQPNKGETIANTLRPDGVRSRGLLTKLSRASKETSWTTMFGHHSEDLLPILTARDTWSAPEDATFPSRRTLTSVIESGVYGPAVRHGITEEALRREATKGWELCQNKQGERFCKRQRVERLHNEKLRKKYLPPLSSCNQRIVMGPWKEQKMYELGAGGVMDLDEALPIPPGDSSFQSNRLRQSQPPSGTRPNETAALGSEGVYGILNETPHLSHQQEWLASQNVNDHSDKRQQTPQRYREGWLLNIGRRVQSMSWAPNREQSSTHYLAIASSTTQEQREQAPEPNDKRNPAFRPSGLYPSNIQIWEFTCLRSRGPSKLDMTVKPRVVLVICTDWGNIRQVKFCPVLRDQPLGLSNSSSTEDSLGLLGVLSSDGYVRVVDLAIPRASQQGNSQVPQYIKIKSPCFDSRPRKAHTIHSSFEWLSPTDLGIANANGSLSVFSILSSTDEPPRRRSIRTTTSSDVTTSPPTPYIHIPSHSTTYIQALSPAYPSPRPTLLATSSLSGYVTLLSLTAPHLTVSPQRQRTASSALRYHPHLRAWFSIEGAMLIALPSRSFSTTMSVARGGAPLTQIATSRWHPHVVFGTAAGEVIGTNPLRRCLPGGKRPGGCQQVLWELNWLRPESVPDSAYASLKSRHPHETQPDPTAPLSFSSPQPQPQPRSSSIYHIPTPHPSGLSRLLTGFLITRPNLAQGGGSGINTHNTHNPRSAEAEAEAEGDANANAKAKSGASKAKAPGVKDPRSAPPSWGPSPKLSDVRWAETIFEEENAVTCLEWGACLANCAWLGMAWGAGWVVVEDVAHGEDSRSK